MSLLRLGLLAPLLLSACRFGIGVKVGDPLPPELVAPSESRSSFDSQCADGHFD